MTNADDRATLAKVLDALAVFRSEKLLNEEPEDFHNHPALLAALRSALQVPDAAVGVDGLDELRKHVEHLKSVAEFQTKRGNKWLAEVETLRAAAENHDCEDVGFERGWKRGLHQGQAEAVARARREAIEEAAREAERDFDAVVKASGPSAALQLLRRLPARLRALAAQPAAPYEDDTMNHGSPASPPPDDRDVAERLRARAKMHATIGGEHGPSIAAACIESADAIERLRRASRTRADYDLRCLDCGAAHNLDCSLPSETWNKIAKPEDILCVLCIDERLARAGIQCAEAEFYFVGLALRGKNYAESHGDVANLRADLARVTEERDEARKRWGGK